MEETKGPSRVQDMSDAILRLTCHLAVWVRLDPWPLTLDPLPYLGYVHTQLWAGHRISLSSLQQGALNVVLTFSLLN